LVQASKLAPYLQMPAIMRFFVLLSPVLSIVEGSQLRLAAGPAASSAASPASAPSAKGEGTETATCNFEISNLDYQDMHEHPDAADGVRHAVMGYVDQEIEGVFAPAAPAAAAPAAAPPASPAAALIAKRNASGPAAAPAGSPAAPAPNNVETFVTLTEGQGDSVLVSSWVVPPAGGMNATETKLKEACHPKNLANALLGAKGVSWAHAPLIKHARAGAEDVHAYTVDCGPHAEKIIKQFSVAYTRRMVPDAVDAACHLFESKIAFSGNNRINKWDRLRCHQATEKLMAQWKGGKGDKDYSGWCHDVCELKMGKGAPMCHL